MKPHLVNSGSKKRTPKIIDVLVHKPNKCSHQTNEFAYIMLCLNVLNYTFLWFLI